MIRINCSMCDCYQISNTREDTKNDNEDARYCLQFFKNEVHINVSNCHDNANTIILYNELNDVHCFIKLV